MKLLAAFKGLRSVGLSGPLAVVLLGVAFVATKWLESRRGDPAAA